MNSIVISQRQQASRQILTSIGALFVALAVIGGLRGYSAVPISDSWGSYLLLLDQLPSNPNVWWAQHNEHRIVLSRLFFWLDLRCFDGAGWFLIVLNYGLLALTAVLFCRILREVAVPPGRRDEKHALQVLIVAILFFWSQQENLTWSFQSQFILAQLLPLTALYALYCSLQGGGAIFALASVLGILSAGTMANGVLALPLMMVYAMLTRQGIRRTGMLALLSVLVLFAYFGDYISPAAHTSFTHSLLTHPLKIVAYALYYLGSPFHFIFGGRALGRLAALVAGIYLVAASIILTRRYLRDPLQYALSIMLLVFIAYIGGTAVGTAGGRLLFGLGQALSQRYTTPALMAWAALLVLHAPALLALQDQLRRRVWGGIALVALLMLATQLTALNSKSEELFDRSIGALAVELRVKDKPEIEHVYPNMDVIAFTQPASDKQRSIFGLYPYRGVRMHMGTSFAPGALPVCRGALEAAEVIEDDARFLRVAGWLYAPSAKLAPEVVRFLDADGKQVGYALTGKARDDLIRTLGKAGRLAGFRGYFSSAQLGLSVRMRGEGAAGPVCEMRIETTSPARINNALARNEEKSSH